MTIAEQLKREGKMEGLKEGMEKGIEKGIEKTAITALKEGLDIKTIARITGLTVERIEELKKILD